MAGPKAKYPIQVLDNQIAELRQLINSRKASQGKIKRAKINLVAHEHPDWSNQANARHAGCSDRGVAQMASSLGRNPQPGRPASAWCYPAIFPLRSERKPQDWLAVCPRRKANHWGAGA